MIALNLFNCVSENPSQKKLKIIKDQLIKTMNEFNKAFKDGNVIILESMITENYTHTNGNSKSIGKKEWINYLRKREKEIKSGNLEVIEYKMNEMEIELFENIAIVTGKIIVSNKEKGEIKKSEYRITNIWVDENGNWKRAGFHDGKIE
ncbi:MAG: nuclear transport factor 2 family protein [Flavobacteriaceae bacterium]